MRGRAEAPCLALFLLRCAGAGAAAAAVPPENVFAGGWWRPGAAPPPLDASTPRIVGGQDAAAARYPFYAYLEVGKVFADGSRGAVRCGGALVHPNLVLTAAHCFQDPNTQSATSVRAVVNNTSVASTSGYEYERTGAEWELHPDYDQDMLINDIAVIVLDQPVTEVTPITTNEQESVPPDGSDVEVMGFGALDDSQDPEFPITLQAVTLQIVDSITCQTELGGTISVNAQTLCAAAPGKDSCIGDSGGPLIYQSTPDGPFVHVGVVSFGFGCAEPNSPGVYSRTSGFSSFIQLAVCSKGIDPLPAYCAGPPAATEPTAAAPITTGPTLEPTPAAATAPVAPTVAEPTPTGAAPTAPQSPAAPSPTTPTPTTAATTAGPTTSNDDNTTIASPTDGALPSQAPSPLSTISPEPSAIPSLGPPVPVGSDPNSRSIQISRTGTAIATSSDRGPLRMGVASSAADFTLGLPGGLASVEDLAVSGEGFVFGLSVYTPALCSFALGDGAAALVPIGCITGPWSLAPFTGIDASAGYVVISGGSGGVTTVSYDTSTGVLNPMLPCMNCTLGQAGAMMPGVAVAKSSTGTPLVSLATVWRNANDTYSAGFIVADAATLRESTRIVFDRFMGGQLAVTATNYPLASAFYYVPQEETHYIYMVHGEMVVYNLKLEKTEPIPAPVERFRATTVAVDELNGVLAVGGSTLNRESHIAVYDIRLSAGKPQLRSFAPVQGQLLSVAANGGRVVYVTAQFPSIAIFDATARLPTSAPSHGPSQVPSSLPVNATATPPTSPRTRPPSTPAPSLGSRASPVVPFIFALMALGAHLAMMQ